ncbi:hypothetical protein PG996_008435 [Apiospora saccharicola]|uniref:Uncharacterized protein n=1 Tax=Apiospora saccharicola TaxID=335842 RepID=A0ABR1V165_9PEZI
MGHIHGWYISKDRTSVIATLLFEMQLLFQGRQQQLRQQHHYQHYYLIIVIYQLFQLDGTDRIGSQVSGNLRC